MGSDVPLITYIGLYSNRTKKRSYLAVNSADFSVASLLRSEHDSAMSKSLSPTPICLSFKIHLGKNKQTAMLLMKCTSMRETGKPTCLGERGERCVSVGLCIIRGTRWQYGFHVTTTTTVFVYLTEQKATEKKKREKKKRYALTAGARWQRLDSSQWLIIIYIISMNTAMCEVTAAPVYIFRNEDNNRKKRW